MPIKKALDDGEVIWPKPPVPGPGASIGDRIEYTLAEGVRRFLELFDEPLAEVFSWTFRLMLKVIERTIGPYTDPIIDYAIAKMEPNDPLRLTLTRLKEAKGEAAAGLLTSLGGGTAAAGLMSVLEPFFERARQSSYQAFPYKTFDMATWVAAFWRGEINRGELDVQMARLGFRTDWLDKLLTTVHPRIAPDDLSAWYLRDRGREGAWRTELLQRGYSEDEVAKIKELLEMIPPVQDIIRMSVREAWREDFAQEWGTDQDYMPVVGEWAEKVGLSEDWVKRYWRAHWELPSLMMGYEMLHRGVINQTQLEELMRALDIMPGWRDKLIEISYNVFTRVDVRRMHKMGILDEAGVKTSYMEQGYDEDKATKMTEFTIAINTEEERDATKTDILTAYEEGVISRDEAAGFLSDIGYQELWIETYLAKIDHKLEEEARKEEEKGTDEELVKERELTKADILSSYTDKVISRDDAAGYLAAILYPASVIELLLTKVDFQVTQKLIREEIETTRVLYVNEDINVSGVHVRLGKYALPASQIDELITLWNFERERKTERPSISQCLAFYYDAIYTEDKLKEQLAKHKLSLEYIEDFVTDANYLILKREQAELERQQKEQERIAASEFKTDRMVQIAALNVNIQEYKVFIAAQKVAMLHVVDPEEKKTMTEDMIIAAAEIVHLQLEIARVPVVPSTTEVV